MEYTNIRNIDNISIDSTKRLINMRKELISHLESEIKQLHNHKKALRDARLINIPFKNFVLLRYWKRYELNLTKDVDNIINTLLQCPYMSSKIDPTDICDCDIEELQDIFGMKQYMYHYCDANGTINWYSCRQYLPIRDTYFVNFMIMNKDEYHRRSRIINRVSQLDFDAVDNATDIIEINTGTFLNNGKKQKYITVDPLDYPVDRRHLLTEKHLQQFDMKYLSHFDTPNDYDIKTDIINIVNEDTSKEYCERGSLKIYINSSKKIKLLECCDMSGANFVYEKN